MNLFSGLNGSTRSLQEFESTHNRTLLMCQRSSYILTKTPASNHIFFYLRHGTKLIKVNNKKFVSPICVISNKTVDERTW